MFRVRSRSWGEAPNAVSERPTSSRESSSWRPVLRRIKKGLFSKSSVSEKPHIGKPEVICTVSGQPLLELHQERLNERLARSASTGQAGTAQEPSNFQNPHGARKPLPVPIGSREPTPPSPSKFLQRPLSSSSSKRRSVQSPREPIFVMRDIHEDEVEIISAGAPATATYIPRRHAASVSDLQLSGNSQRKQQTGALLSRRSAPPLAKAEAYQPKRAVYQPQHAASDFSKLMLPFDLDSNGLAQNTSSDPANIATTILDPSRHHRLSAHSPDTEADTELDDYQRFIQASGLVAVTNYNSYGILSSSDFTPKRSQLMQEIASNRQSLGRERAYALPRRETASRPVSCASGAFDSVAEYAKPTRAESIRSQRARLTLTGVDREGGVRRRVSWLHGEWESQGERSTSHWRNFGGSTGQPVSGDRDTGRDENVRGYLDLEDEKGGGKQRKRRSWTMPTSPGLRRLNGAVRRGVVDLGERI